MNFFDRILDAFNRPRPQQSPAIVAAWMQFFHSGLSLFLLIATLFDGSLQRIPGNVQGLVFGAFLISFLLAGAGIFFGYGLLKYRVWAWVATFILQSLTAVAGIHHAWEWLNQAASSMQRYPVQPLSPHFGSWLLWVHIILSLSILQTLFQARKEFFRS